MDSTLRLHGQRGYRAVVEHAATLAVIAEGMMGAAGEVYGNAFFKREAAGFDSGAGRAARSLDHLRRPRKPDPADLGGRKFAASHPPQITGVMGPQNFVIGCRMELAQRVVSGQPRLQHTLPQK